MILPLVSSSPCLFFKPLETFQSAQTIVQSVSPIPFCLSFGLIFVVTIFTLIVLIDELLHWPALKKIFKVNGLSIDIWSPFYAEFKNTIHCVWSGLVFKKCLNTSQQVVHINYTYSKACELYLSQLIVCT